MNIVGEGFHPSIIKQVNKRQEIYGSVNRDNRELSYLNARTGWCKLISSVNVDNANIRNLGLTGTELAERFVLFGGVYNEQNNSARSGIWQGVGSDVYNASTPNNAFAYGIGGTEFGLNAMPGIIQTIIKTETMGSIKTATVTIRANNRNQFDIIDILYLRLGFTTLLEWGNSSYFTNDGTYITDNPYSLADEFLNGTITYDNVLDKINKNRIDSNGNYDALFGKVVNFNWTFTNEGAYDITVKIIGYGDVIESIKTNVLLPSNNPTTTYANENTPGFVGPPKPAELKTTEDTILDFANTHEIGRFFSNIQRGLQDKSTEQNGMGITAVTNDETKNPTTGYKEGNKASVIYFKQIYQNATTGNGNTQNQYYIKLGYFLYWLQENIIPYVNDPKVRMLKIDYDVNTNVIYLLGRQTSTNPRICIFKRTFFWDDGSESYFCENGDDFTFKKNNNTYGYIMNAYFNIAWILEQLESLKDEKGNVGLFDLLNALCQGWNNATGNFNTLKVFNDTENHTIKLIDEIPLPDRDDILKSFNNPDISTETAMFDVYRYNNQNSEAPQAGFVRNFNFNTTVAPNLATLITVGATSNGYVVGQDATALSRMNAGLTDRIKKQVGLGSTFDVDIATASTGSLEQNYKDQINNFRTFLQNLGSVNNQTYPIWNQEAIDNFSNSATTFYEYDQAKQTQEAANLLSKSNPSSPSSPNIGFLPFDAQITMDGLSGMKVYQKFMVDTDFLPTNYPEALEFLIKGITNTISNNEWITVLDSIAIPKNPFGSVIGNYKGRSGFKYIPNNYPIVNTSAYPNVTFQNSDLGTPTSDQINPNLLSDISKAAQAAGLNVVVTTAVSGHNYETSSGNVSRHGAGNAVDIAIINGVGSGNATNSTNGNAQFRTDGNKLKNELVKLGYVWNAESGNNKAILWQTSTGGNHYNHIHVSRRT